MTRTLLAVSSPSHSVASSAGVTTPQASSPLPPCSANGSASAPPGHVQQTHQSQAAHPQLPQAPSSAEWFDNQLARPAIVSTQTARPHRSPSIANVETAASQIVHKAMQYLTVDGQGSQGKPDLRPSFKLDSASLLDKVGKACPTV